LRRGLAHVLQYERIDTSSHNKNRGQTNPHRPAYRWAGTMLFKAFNEFTRLRPTRPLVPSYVIAAGTSSSPLYGQSPCRFAGSVTTCADYLLEL
jgi:hypothetical protein